MKHPHRTGVWARCLGFALALLAAKASLITGQVWAQGTIVHVIPPQPIPYSDYPFSQDIDLNGDGTADFDLWSWNSRDIYLTPLNNNAILSVPEPPGDLGALIYALSPGAPVTSSLDPPFLWWDASGNAPPTIVSTANIGSIGYFQGQTDAYAGIRLDVAGSVYFGWVHIENFGGNWGQISDWAYESNPNTPIFAGDLPEPSTAVLLVVGGWMLRLARKRF